MSYSNMHRIGGGCELKSESECELSLGLRSVILAFSTYRSISYLLP